MQSGKFSDRYSIYQIILFLNPYSNKLNTIYKQSLSLIFAPQIRYIIFN